MKKKIFSLLLVLFVLFCVVGCKKNPSGQNNEALEKAKSFIYNMYKDGAEETADDYQLVSQVTVDGVKYEVVWTVEVKSGSAEDVKVVPGDKTTIDVNKFADADVVYTLVATIKDEKGNTIEQKFDKKVPAFALTTWAEFMAAEKGTMVNVKGRVAYAWKETDSTALVYFQNNDGGFYAYRLAITPESFETLKPGVEILVTGKKDIYSTVFEVVSATFEVIDETIKEVPVTDITELYKAAEKISDKALTDKQGMLCTLKGVELLNIEDKYLWFQLDGKKAYIYISSSTCFASAEQQAALKEKMVNGQTADITGFISLYNNEIQFLPIDDNAIVHVKEELTDDQIIAKAEEKVLALAAEGEVSANLDLFTETPQGAKLVWTSGNTDLIADDGKIVSYPLEATDVELTAKITAGTKEKEVKVTVKVAALAPSTASEINKACAADEKKVYMLEGQLIALDKSGYGFVADGTGVVYVRAKFTGFEIGDTVRVIGTPTKYTSKQYTYQMSAKTEDITKIEKEIKVMEPVLIHGSDLAKPANEAEAFANRYYGLLVKMTVTVGYKTVGTYTNPYITFDDGSEGMYWYSAGKLDEFKALDGKTIEIVAPIYSYFTDNYEMWFLGTFVTAKEGTAELKKTEGAVSLTEAVALADKAEVAVDAQISVCVPGTGLVVTDGTQSLFVYSGKNVNIDGLKVGDYVSVTGKMGTYNNGRQIASPVITLTGSGTYKVKAVAKTLDEINALDPTDVTIYGKAFKTTLTIAVNSSGYVNAAEGNSLYLTAEDKEELAKLNGQQVEIVVYIYNYNSKAKTFNLFADAKSIGAEEEPEHANIKFFEDGVVGQAYNSEMWTREKYTTEWEAMSGQMNCRDKDGVKVVNVVGGWSMTNMFTYNKGGESLGLANKFTVKIGNYFSNAAEFPVKLFLVKTDGSRIYLLGSADEFYSFPVTTGLEAKEFTFDPAEIVSVVIVNKSTKSDNVYLYFGDMVLSYAE